MNLQSGQLASFGSPPYNLPDPPPLLAPRGSLDEARALALRFGTELRGEALAESPFRPFRLRIWYPSVTEANALEAGVDYSPVARAAVAAHRGVLAYVGWVVGGSRAAGAGLAVDALTGAVIDVEEPDRGGSAGGAGGGSPVAAPGALDVPTAPPPLARRHGRDGLARLEHARHGGAPPRRGPRPRRGQTPPHRRAGRLPRRLRRRGEPPRHRGTSLPTRARPRRPPEARNGGADPTPREAGYKVRPPSTVSVWPVT